MNTGDRVTTDYTGGTTEHTMTARRDGCVSQTGVMFQVEPPLRTWRDTSNPYDEFPAWYDSGWFLAAAGSA